MRNAVAQAFRAGFFLFCAPLLVEAQNGNVASPPRAAETGTLIVNGFVRDTAGNPLSGAEVYTLLGQRTLTDERGAFYLDKVPAGAVDIIFRRIGYIPASLGFDSQPDLKVSLATQLISSAQTLPMIVVEGKQMNWALYKAGFYKRQLRGSGVFLSPEDLDKTQASLSSLVRRSPGIRVDHVRNASIATTRSGFRGERCVLSVYVDGALVPWASEEGLDRVVQRDDILAIEIFERGAALPMRYQDSRTPAYSGDFNNIMRQGSFASGAPSARQCGSILIWTKPVSNTRK